MKLFTRNRKYLTVLLTMSLVIAGSSLWSKGYAAKETLPAGSGADPIAAALPDSAAAPKAEARAREAYGQLPLSFEANRGQADARVKFMTRNGNAALFLTADGATLTLAKPRQARRKQVSGRLAKPERLRLAAVRMTMQGGNSSAEVEGLDQLPGASNYFIGKDPSRWHKDIPLFAKVRYREVYPGINVVYYGNNRQLEYDLEVAPGSDPRRITMAFTGAQKLRLDRGGDLWLRTPAGEIQLRKPAVYQYSNGQKQAVACRYVLKGKRQVGFDVAPYDSREALVIDPVFNYATYLGGNNDDRGRAVAVDANGNAYITGTTSSFNFPVTLDAYSTTYRNSIDFFVTKLTPDGSALVYSTYIGGDSSDYATGIAIDSTGAAYVTGFTASMNYPTTAGAFQTALTSGSYYYLNDAVITKLSPGGDALIYSTFLGGAGDDQSNGIAVDADGNAYVAGYTTSANFPTTAGAFQTTLSSGGDAFVTKLNSAGSGLIYSTFLGGSGTDQVNGLKLDAAGNLFLTGFTTSNNFPTTAGAYQTTYGGTAMYSNFGDAFVTKLNGAATALLYSTYLGGSGDDNGYGIALGANGEAYVTGVTASGNFPTTPGVVRVSNGGMAKATDGGASWAAISAGITNTTIISLAIDPVTPTTLFAGTSGGGVFKSTNGGSGWSLSSIDPTATSTIYLGTLNRGIFRSTNGGTSWRAINTGQNGMNVSSLKVDPANHEIVYAGTEYGVYKTTNGGASWEAFNNGLGQNHSANVLAINPANSATLYAGLTYGGIYKSTNGGATWTAYGLSNTTISALAIDATNPAILFAGTNGSLYRSTDAGVNWFPVNGGLTNRTINAVAVSPANSMNVYVGTVNGVFHSTDGGTLWGPINKGLAGAAINTLSIDPTAAQTIYVGMAAGGIDAFVTELNAAGSGLAFSTLLGGSGTDTGYAIATDAPGNIYVTGNSTSMNFPTTPGLYPYQGGYSDPDAFVTKLDPAAATLIYSTALGGYSSDTGYGIAVDSSGNAFVVGATSSSNFPVTGDAYQLVLNNGTGYYGDAFVARLRAAPSLSSDLSISISGPSNSVLAGNNVNYTITVTNNGPDPASSVVVSDDMPSSLLFGNCYSSSIGCTQTGNGARFSINSIAVGQSITLNVSGYVACSIPATATVANTVTVDSASIDSDTSNNSATSMVNATNPPPTLSSTQAGFGPDSGSGSLNINNSTNCSWTAVSNANWITINSYYYYYVNYSVAANLGPARVGTMTIAGQTFTVNQSSGCTYLVGPNPVSVGGDGGSGSVNVTASDSACPWSAVSNDTWITVTAGSSGTGNGTVNFSVAPNAAANANSNARTGTLTVAGQTITVNQSGLSCGFTLGSAGQSFNAGSGAGSVSVTTSDSNCAWTAMSNASWITVTAGSSGTGNGTVNFSVTNNSDSTPRSATLTIAGQSFTVYQGASFLDVPSNYLFYDFIGRLSSRGITQGCGGGNFCPEATVTREQMAAFIMRALGEPNPPTPATQRFTDVPPSNPFYAYIDRVAALGITQGCGGGNYCPSAAVTREQMAAFIIRALGESSPPPPASQRFNDVPPTSPFYAYIDRMAARQITSGCSTAPPLYCPTALVTRGQMAVFLVKAFGL